ncbi:hypothetical protein TNIN_181101 [Trichonephila inaurata madagascariensis]|uniref:Uncharacterized protein n=1 Tax=Trichonephila inaurata madagascariensis TaxID=2747483 RepID=A0A8X6XRB6_9ARAC|nr:hypothetical protein TNIN_181101 [Trichonephila inaurata madagascariensis]
MALRSPGRSRDENAISVEKEATPSESGLLIVHWFLENLLEVLKSSVRSIEFSTEDLSQKGSWSSLRMNSEDVLKDYGYFEGQTKRQLQSQQLTFESFCGTFTPTMIMLKIMERKNTIGWSCFKFHREAVERVTLST